MKRTSKRLLAGIAGMLFLVILETAAGLAAGKEPRKDSGGPGTYRSQEEGKILEIDREKGEITVQSTEGGKEILLDCSKESVMEDVRPEYELRQNDILYISGSEEGMLHLTDWIEKEKNS